jgi:hydroxyethylthiazole kinase-like uncharacterized protein yjeF
MPMSDPYPPHESVSAATARAADARAAAEFGIPGLVLMEHAARGVATLVGALAPADRRPVVVLCGPGQNGGDGFGAARFLRSFGRTVLTARIATSAPRGDAATEWLALEREQPVTPLRTPEEGAAWCDANLPGAGLAVDALFGIGLDRDLGALPRVLVERMNEATCLRVAVDVPSGLDAEAGGVHPIAVRADVTAAMGFVKRGCTTAQGAPWCGRIVEIDIGLPLAIHGPWIRTPGPREGRAPGSTAARG